MENLSLQNINQNQHKIDPALKLNNKRINQKVRNQNLQQTKIKSSYRSWNSGANGVAETSKHHHNKKINKILNSQIMRMTKNLLKMMTKAI